jgi:hypothetical protein
MIFKACTVAAIRKTLCAGTARKKILRMQSVYVICQNVKRVM